MIRQGEALRPVRPGDIVILLRSPGSCARYYRSALEARGIPALAGAGGSMLDTGEAAVLRSFLQVLDNPLQDIPLEAVLASPVFRFTADHLGESGPPVRMARCLKRCPRRRRQGTASPAPSWSWSNPCARRPGWRV